MSYGGVKYSLFKSVFNHINSKRGHSSAKRTLQAFLWKKKICYPGNFIVKDNTQYKGQKLTYVHQKSFYFLHFPLSVYKNLIDNITTFGVLWSKTLLCYCIQIPESCMWKTGATGFSGTQTLNFLNISVTTVT